MTEMHAYDDRSTHAVYSVLIELGQVLGGFTDRFVVVGGSVPWLLLPGAQPQHLGTIDVDLSLDHEALGDGEYVNFVGLLERAGYERNLDDLRPFQMARAVDIDQGPPVKVIVDFLMPRKAKLVKNEPPLLAGFAVQRAHGADVANSHYVEHELHGRMPDGRLNTVQLRVASIPALLVMKGYALVGRDKPKDAYDIYYVIRHYDGGAEVLAEACRPLLSRDVALDAYRNIASKFSAADGYGPQSVRKFLVESGATEGMTPAQMAQDAFGQVRNWLAHLGLPSVR